MDGNHEDFDDPEQSAGKHVAWWKSASDQESCNSSYALARYLQLRENVFTFEVQHHDIQGGIFEVKIRRNV